MTLSTSSVNVPAAPRSASEGEQAVRDVAQQHRNATSAPPSDSGCSPPSPKRVRRRPPAPDTDTSPPHVVPGLVDSRTAEGAGLAPQAPHTSTAEATSPLPQTPLPHSATPAATATPGQALLSVLASAEAAGLPRAGQLLPSGDGRLQQLQAVLGDAGCPDESTGLRALRQAWEALEQRVLQCIATARAEEGLGPVAQEVVSGARHAYASCGAGVSVPSLLPALEEDEAGTRSRRRTRGHAGDWHRLVVVEGRSTSLGAALAAGGPLSGAAPALTGTQATALRYAELVAGRQMDGQGIGNSGGLGVMVPRLVYSAYGQGGSTVFQQGEEYKAPANAELVQHGFMLMDAMGHDGHFSICSACGHRGGLVLCESCPTVFHPKCSADMAAHGIPDTTWHCPLCQLRDGVMPCLPHNVTWSDSPQYAACVQQEVDAVLAPVVKVQGHAAAVEAAPSLSTEPASVPVRDPPPPASPEQRQSPAQAPEDEAAPHPPRKWLGVYHTRGKYRCAVSGKGKRYHVGYFKTALEAAAAYDAKVLSLRGGGSSGHAWAKGLRLNEPDTAHGKAAAEERWRASEASKAAFTPASPPPAEPEAPLDEVQLAALAGRLAAPLRKANLPVAACAEGRGMWAAGSVPADERAMGEAYLGVSARPPTDVERSALWGAPLMQAARHVGQPEASATPANQQASGSSSVDIEGAGEHASDSGSDATPPPAPLYSVAVPLPGSRKSLAVGAWEDPHRAALAFNLARHRVHGGGGPWKANYISGVGTGLTSAMPPFKPRVLRAPGAEEAARAARLRAERVRRVARGGTLGGHSTPLAGLAAARRQLVKAAARLRQSSAVEEGSTLAHVQPPLTAKLTAPCQGASASVAAPSGPHGRLLDRDQYSFAWRYKHVYGQGLPTAVLATVDALDHFKVIPRPMQGPRARQEEGVLLLAGAAAGEACAQSLLPELEADAALLRAAWPACDSPSGDTDADSWVSEFDACSDVCDGESVGWFRLGPNTAPRYQCLMAQHETSEEEASVAVDSDGEAASVSSLDSDNGVFPCLAVGGDGPQAADGWCRLFGAV